MFSIRTIFIGTFLCVVSIAVAVRAEPDTLELKANPIVRHLGPDRVEIRWPVEKGHAFSVRYGTKGSAEKEIVAKHHESFERAILTDLPRDADVWFQISLASAGSSPLSTQRFTMDTSTDIVSETMPVTETSGSKSTWLVERIVQTHRTTRGYALLLGCRDAGQLAAELARATPMQIIAVEPDPRHVATARRALDAASLYGVRVSVHQGTLNRLPYADYFANLVVYTLADTPGCSVKEICRVLRPHGGIAWVGHSSEDTSRLDAWKKDSPLDGWKHERTDKVDWIMLHRGPKDGSGEWTHLYANPANTACSGDSLETPLEIQWFGRPGPRHMIDRHHRTMAPLSASGRLIVPGNHRLKAVDAYHGTPLWDLSIPGFRRVAVLRNSGHLAVDDGRVYALVDDTCRVIDAASGQWLDTFHVPSTAGSEPVDWGYLAVVGDRLLGTSERHDASYYEHNRTISGKISFWDHVPTVTGRSMFSMDRQTGTVRWTYRHAAPSVLVHPAIAVGDDRVYFVESRSAEAFADPDGRVPLRTALSKGSSFLVACDLSTGKPCWEHPIDLVSVHHALFVSYAQGSVLVTGTYNEAKHPRYDLWSFSAEDGTPQWTSHYVRTDKPVGGDHGEQDQHPVIVGDTIYARPVAFDLASGEKRPFELRRAGGGCGAMSASTKYLFGRGSNPQLYPIASGGTKNVPLTRITRPGCWINMIPAGGLLLIPEASSGCSCAYSIQASLGFAPKRE